MKKLSKIFLIFLVLFSSQIASSNAEEKKCYSIDVKLFLTAHFVTLPDAPSFTASGGGTLNYELVKGGAKIDGSSIPKLKFESEKPVADFKKLSVIVEAIPGTISEINWSKFPKVTLSALELRVRAYDKNLNEIDESIKPILDIILSDQKLSTENINVEGVESAGYIDGQFLEVQLVGKTILPDETLEPLYSQYLANEPILLELRVKAINPFEK